MACMGPLWLIACAVTAIPVWCVRFPLLAVEADLARRHLIERCDGADHTTHHTADALRRHQRLH